MKISREARRTARELFRWSLVDGHVDAARVEHASKSIVADRPRGFLGILKEYTRLIRLELAKRHAVVEGAAPLDESTATAITNNLKTTFGQDITIEYLTNPSLLGGLRVRFGSDVWDGSIRSRLNAFSNHL